MNLCCALSFSNYIKNSISNDHCTDLHLSMFLCSTCWFRFS